MRESLEHENPITFWCGLANGREQREDGTRERERRKTARGLNSIINIFGGEGVDGGALIAKAGEKVNRAKC